MVGLITVIILLGAMFYGLVEAELLNFPCAGLLPWVLWGVAAALFYKVTLGSNKKEKSKKTLEEFKEPEMFTSDDDLVQELDAVFENGVLTINEGVEIIDFESIFGYEGLRKVIFPASLKEIASCAIIEQDDIEELDFSKVTKLKVLPEYMVKYVSMPLTRFIIPQGVEVVEKSFLCACELNELYIPNSVRSIRFPLDFGEEMEGEVYVYAKNLDIRPLAYNPVGLDIYVLEEYYDNYKTQLTKFVWDEWTEDLIRLHKMPQNKRNFYGTPVVL
jgi:hypothetical protein